MKRMIVLPALLLSACSLDPAQMSTEKLCARYTAPLSSQKNDPAVRDELLRRGARSCVDPALAAIRSENALVSGLLGPPAGAIHSSANPLPPLEDEAYQATKAVEQREMVARLRAEQTARQMIQEGKSDAEIAEALKTGTK